MRDASEIERAVTTFARGSNGGLIVTASALSSLHRELINTLAARHKLPAVCYRRGYVTDGGLISYGYDADDQYRRAEPFRLLRCIWSPSGTKRRFVAAQDLRQLSVLRTCGRLVPVVSGADADHVRQAVDIGSQF